APVPAPCSPPRRSSALHTAHRPQAEKQGTSEQHPRAFGEEEVTAMGRSDSAPFDPEWFTKELMERGIATPEQITGCTPEEVAEVLAEKKDVSVPQAYVDFLRDRKST